VYSSLGGIEPLSKSKMLPTVSLKKLDWSENVREDVMDAEAGVERGGSDGDGWYGVVWRSFKFASLLCCVVVVVLLWCCVVVVL
jgi:hypothetical protein